MRRSPHPTDFSGHVYRGIRPGADRRGVGEVLEEEAPLVPLGLRGLDGGFSSFWGAPETVSGGRGAGGGRLRFR